MRKIILFSIIAIAIIILLLIFTPAGLFLTAIQCGLSPSCAMNSQNSESITEQAIVSKDIKLCNKLPKEIWFSTTEPRADCYVEYALKNKDLNVCFKMRELKLSTMRSIDIDEGTFEGNPLQCYIGVAILTKNSELCKNLVNIEPYFNNFEDYEKDRFLLMCYGGVAKTLNDKSICDNLNGENKLWCLVPFSNRSICDQFSERGKDFCNEWFDNNKSN